MDRTRRHGAAVLLVLATSCAHGHHEEAPPAVATTTTTGARMLMNDDAAMRLAKARCEHESACGHVGKSARFASSGVCTDATFKEAWSVVRDEACPAGVDEARLTTCLAYVRNQACDAGGLGAIGQCRGDMLCAAPAR